MNSEENLTVLEMIGSRSLDRIAYEKIKGDDGKILELVKEHPEVAYRLCNIFSDRDIARTFIRVYSEDPNYMASASHLARDFFKRNLPEGVGIPIADEFAPDFRDVVLTYSFPWGPSVKGDNFWESNQLDNGVRALEDCDD